MSETTFNINFDNVPDTIPKIPNGIYDLKINGWKINPPKPSQSKPGEMTAPQLELELEIKNAPTITVDEKPYDLNGRKLRDWISQKMETRLKRLFLSAGAPVGANGADCKLLSDKIVRAVIVNTVSQKDGVTREFPNIQDYLIPGDQGFPAPATA